MIALGRAAMAGRYLRIKNCLKDLLKNREGRKASSLSS